jgi:hypothetical protein
MDEMSWGFDNLTFFYDLASVLREGVSKREWQGRGKIRGDC